MGIYKNVMEMLVEEEVSQQVKSLPPNLASYMNPAELVAYALNQLPALYATSQRGLEYQVDRGREKYGAQIKQAVKRAMAAIRRDPLRTYPPLPEQQSTPLREVLTQIRLLLRNDKVDWESLPIAVEQALRAAAQGTWTWDSSAYTPRSTTTPRRSRTAQGLPSPHQAAAKRQSESNETSDGIFGWDDPLYDPR